MWYFVLFLIFFTCSPVLSIGTSECQTHDFRGDISDFWNNGGTYCGSMRSWEQKKFDSVNVDPFHPYSESFVMPETVHSCIYSNDFAMENDGILEFNVYMDLHSTLDQIRIIAYEIQGSGIQSVAEYTGSTAHPNYKDGWNTFPMPVKGSNDFKGFIVISGRATSNSHILVDSFRYIPPIQEEQGENSTEVPGEVPDKVSEDIDDDERCPIYKPLVYECIEYTFGPEYTNFFNNDNKICTNAETWEISIIENDVFGITPKVTGTPSCISTPKFLVPSGGNLTVEVFIQSQSYFDSILVAMTDDDDIINASGYNRLVTNDFKLGSTNTLTLELKDIETQYEGQITFVGFATEGATVLVKSFKFTPTEHDQEICRQLTDTRRHVVTD